MGGAMIPNPNCHTLLFTGWESDRFVRFAELLLSRGITPRVRVVGREPVANIEADFVGTVVQTIWEGYRRIIVVETDDGVTYQVGGTNSTRPIASESVFFQDVPVDIVGPSYRDDQLRGLLAEFCDRPSESQQIADALKHNIRLGHLSLESRRVICSTLVQSLESDDWHLRRTIAEIMGLCEMPEVLEPLLVLLDDCVPEVREEVTLRFRGLEPVIKDLGESSQLGRKCIRALTAALDDPSDSVRIYAAEDLGYFYDEDAVEALIRVLATDKHPHARWAAVIALGRTNKLEVAQHLVAALETDSSIYVQQGAALGLGRIGVRAITSSKAGLVERLVTDLREKLVQGPSAVQDYAAYTLGELGKAAITSFEALVEALDHGLPFETKSSATLSLTKLLPHCTINPDQMKRLQGYLSNNLGLPRPTGWPSSAFYSWFLASAAELSALLELHGLASEYYRRASGAFARVGWLSQYYGGMRQYELAEYHCSEGDLAAASRCLDGAVEALVGIEQLEDFTKQSDAAKSGLGFKSILAQARREIVFAAVLWSNAALGRDDYLDIKKHFEQAVGKYRLIDVLGLSENTKTLSKAEINLVLSLKMLAEIGQKLVRLKLLSLDLAGDQLLLALGGVRADIRSLERLVVQTRSAALRERTLELVELIDTTYERDPRLYPITEVVDEFLEKAKLVYGSALPTPGTCPVVDFGNANMQVALRGSLSGDGSSQRPFLFPSATRLVFEFTVAVNRRTKNDQLVFRALNPPTSAGRLETVQEVPVHESLYSLRPVDYGEFAPGPTAIQFSFLLEFRNQGCSQPVHSLDTWVRVYDAQREFTEPSDRLSEKREYLRAKIRLLENDLKDTKSAIDKFVDKPPFELKQQMRQIEIKLSTTKEDAARVEEQLHGV